MHNRSPSCSVQQADNACDWYTQALVKELYSDQLCTYTNMVDGIIIVCTLALNVNAYSIVTYSSNMTRYQNYLIQYI